MVVEWDDTLGIGSRDLNSYPLVICYIAMENDPFIDDVPIKSDDFPWLC